MMSQLTEQAAEMEELKDVMARQKDEQKKLVAEKTALEQLTQTIERLLCMM